MFLYQAVVITDHSISSSRGHLHDASRGKASCPVQLHICKRGQQHYLLFWFMQNPTAHLEINKNSNEWTLSSQASHHLT
ncbi:unnamed protein product [Urochloa humidicola]